MQEQKISVKMGKNIGSKWKHTWDKEVTAFVVGDLAVHLVQGEDDECSDWAITAINRGLKFPGVTPFEKVAIACAKEINEMGFDWSEFSKERHKDEALKAKAILVSWGVVE